MSRKRIKQYLLLLTAVGLIAVAASGAGTFASFSAETTNDNNVFATGTLFLHDTANGTTCTSESSADNLSASGCSALFSLASSADFNKPGSTEQADLTLTNAGTLSASTLAFYEKSACDGTKLPTIATLAGAVTSGDSIPGTGIVVSGLIQKLVAGTPILVDGETLHVKTDTSVGATAIPVTETQWAASHADTSVVNVKADFTPADATGLCGQLKISIAEASDDTYGTLTCVYPTTTGQPTNTGCGSGTALDATALHDSANPVALAGGLTAGASRYLRIYVAAPTGLTNGDQNKTAGFDLTWHAE